MKKLLSLLTLTVLGASLVANAGVEVGKAAPDFRLKDTSGKERSLSEFKGKTVVLEWVNYGCPFVKKHYGAGNMQALQKKAAEDGVVWLSICSSAPEKQGHMTAEDAVAKNKEVGNVAAAYLLDEDGKVGKTYGATRTPEMFIVNEEGILVYHGAIDDKPTAKSEDIEGATNYVTVALGEIAEGKPVSNGTTTPYGCGVKYP
ncbi:MAG: thioredoxin family protein [Chthoniobacterales bacterium]